MKIINNVNFNKKQLKNAVIELLGTAPASPTTGQIYFNDGSVTAGDKGFYIYNGSAWSELTDQSMTAQQILDAIKTVDGAGSGLDADTLDGYSSASFYLATTTLNNITAPTGSLSLSNQKITNLGTPTAGTSDAATTQYVDDKVAAYVRGLDPKESVDRVVEVPITLSGENITNDDFLFYPSGLQVLVTAQSPSSDNGIYVVGSGAWSRRADAVPGTTLTTGAYTFEEATGKGYVYKGTNDEWKRFDERTVVSAGTGVVVNTSGTTSTVSLDGTNGYGVRRIAGFVPSGNASAVITHDLNSKDVVVSIREVSTDEIVFATVTATSTTSITVTFDVAPTSMQYRYTIIG